MSQRSVFRFAPSPNGYLHLGHAYCALLNADMARRAGGRFLLRIEDIDTHRARQEYEQHIYEDLAWLGLRWEEPVMRQSARSGAYEEALSTLREKGVVYPCFATRGDIRSAIADKAGHWPRDPDGQPLYPGIWRGAAQVDILRQRALERPFCWRLDMSAATDLLGHAATETISWHEMATGGRLSSEIDTPAAWGDVIIARKDISTSYHLAVVVDDANQGITHVVRGMDLRPATGVHRILQMLLDLPAPVYHHHDLVLDESGEKLSKSRGSESIRALREAGDMPAAIRERLDLAT